MLEELRLFGIHEQLSARIEQYLQVPTIEALYQQVLERWEQDYDPARRGLWNPPEKQPAGMVAQALSLIAAARRGLSETELLDILGKPPRAAWSPLYLAIESEMIERDGILSFTHAQLKQAVEKRYLQDLKSQRTACLRLADHFKKGVFYWAAVARGEHPRRVFDELPWLWRMAGEWQALYDLLADWPAFRYLWKSDPYELKRDWAAIEASSELRKTAAYQAILASPEGYDNDLLWSLASLLEQTGSLDEAFMLYETLAWKYRKVGEYGSFQKMLICQSGILQARGQEEEALKLSKLLVNNFRQSGNQEELKTALFGIANLHYKRGEFDEAAKISQEVEQICRQTGDLNNANAIRITQANILFTQGKCDDASMLYQETETYFRQVGNLENQQASLCGMANVLSRQGNLDGAMKLYQEQEKICRQLGAMDGLLVALGGQAMIYRRRNELDDALRYYQEQEGLFRKLGRTDSLVNNLVVQVKIARTQGQFVTSISLLRQVLEIFERQENINIWGRVKNIILLFRHS
jgi:tetratricopeptide (TPR) repeat protein